MVLSGAFLAVVGMVLWLIETGPNDGIKGSRQKFAESWSRLGNTPWAGVPRYMTGWLLGKMNGLVCAGISDVDRNIGFGAVVFVLLFIFLPIAAALNALIGGSPFLFWYFLSLLAALGFLNFSGETKRFKVLNGIAAAYLGLSIFAVIPIYVLHSFTDVTIQNFFTHAVLKSFLVAVIWYVAAYGLSLIFDTILRSRGVDPEQSALARFVHGFLVALPVAYVMFFMALLAGHLSVFEQAPARSWQILLFSVSMTALSFPATLFFLSDGVKTKRPDALVLSFMVAALGALVFSILAALGYLGSDQGVSDIGFFNVLVGLAPDGSGGYLSPQFWVLHLPFLPLGLFLCTIFFGLVGKVSVLVHCRFSSSGVPEKQPYLTLALTCVLIGVFFWGLAAFI